METRDYPIIALRGLTVFPGMVIHFDLSRKKSIEAARVAMQTDQKIVLFTQKDVDIEDPKAEELYEIGTLAIVKQITKLPNKIVRILVEGVDRVSQKELDTTSEKHIFGSVELIEEPEGEEVEDTKEEAMARMVLEYVAEYAGYFPKVAQTLDSQLADSLTLPQILDRIAMNLPVGYDRKQEVLSALTLVERYDAVMKILYDEVEVAQIKEDLAGKIKEQVEKNQKDYILREQLSYIKKELDAGDELSETERFMQQLEELQASESVKEKIKKEIKRYQLLNDSSSESAVERSYIETLLEMPWDKMSDDTLDLNHAEDILEENHYGMEKVKERILEFLAVRSLTKDSNGPIICLVGPPGTGKTSIAKSVAQSLQKEYIRICLGGVRDEAEIRGHRRTYVGSMPGRIATGLKQAGVKNPLMLLDEIDKVSNDYKGDTFSALLEVLDPDQNKHFRDHYLEVPLDLSQVLFLATANTTSTIPRPLLDRMEIIEVSGYTENEKFHIAKEHLMKKQMKENGMNGKKLSITDKVIYDIIRFYTRESGVRELDRKIGTVCRKAAREWLQNDGKKINVNGKNLDKYLGTQKYRIQMANAKPEVGIVRGLAWTEVGGDTLQIEVSIMPGKGELELTGQMGEVMKESAGIGISYIRTIAEKYDIKPEYFKEHDFHIHIPEGAVPKDGPSAGITMATAVLSAITEKKVDAKVAMTGEITLRGKVLPIGGLREKLLAARVAGIKKVLIPKDNEKDMEEITQEIIGDMEILYMEDMKDVIKHAFVSDTEE